MHGKRKSVYGTVTALLIVGIVVVANLVSANLFARMDLTEGHIFSLDSASKRMLRSLDDDFLVKAYFSSNLPAPYNANAKYVQDKLEEYRAFGKGHFRFEFVDPGDDAVLEQEARKHRIPPVQVQVVEQDQIQVKKVYMGLVFLYQDRQETIPVVQDPTGLEYEITSAIKKLTRDSSELPLIGILQGHEEPGLDQLTRVQQVFEKQYRLRPVNLADGARVPADMQLVVVASPRSAFSDWEKYALDQFIMRGGKVAFLIDKVDADLQMGRATPLRLNLDDWLEGYGVRVNDNLIGDLQNPGMLSVTQQEGFFQMVTQVPYPFIPSIRDFNREIIMVKDLERVGLFYASSIDTSVARRHDLKVEPLFYTSPHTSVQEGSYNINPQQKWKPEDFDRGQQIMAAVVYGPFHSFFEGKPVPAPSDSAEIPIRSPEDTTRTLSPPTRLVVVGDGEFFSDSKGGGDPVNLLFFQNMVDWLMQDDDLIRIRSRVVTDRPLNMLTPQKRRIVRDANILGSPLLVVVFGLVAWQARRRRKVEL